jgi:hypothetical protein
MQPYVRAQRWCVKWLALVPANEPSDVIKWTRTYQLAGVLLLLQELLVPLLQRRL